MTSTPGQRAWAAAAAIERLAGVPRPEEANTSIFGSAGRIARVAASAVTLLAGRVALGRRAV